MRKISAGRVLWLCGCLFCAAPAVAQDGVAIPELDVADSVRRMLEAGRGQEGVVEITGQPEAAVPSAPLPAAAPPAAALPAPEPARPAAAGTEPAHVPVPVREITIRSVDDIRALARELEEAKQRQQR